MLADLAPDLAQVLRRRVDPVSTAFLGGTSSRYKSIVGQSTVWEHYCKNRWSHVNYGLLERDGEDLNSSNNLLEREDSYSALCGRAAGSWMTVYGESNGWNSPRIT